MKRTRFLITLCVVSAVLLVPGIAGAQVISKSPFDMIDLRLNDILNRVKALQQQNANLQSQLNAIQQQNVNVQIKLDDIEFQVEDLPPTWSKKYGDAGRFEVLSSFNNEAVLDRETGLVWERSPHTGKYDWYNAQDRCNAREIANRKGFRLPASHELASLVDLGYSNPSLTDGHPFQNVQSDTYWSATDRPPDSPVFPNWGRAVEFYYGLSQSAAKDGHFPVWCVRGE